MKTRSVLLMILALCAAFLLSCGHTDDPPESDTPDPPPHDGVFVSDYGALTFNGDGESVTIAFTHELSAAVGFPDGELEGTYAFLFHHGLFRYDKAEQFALYIEGADYSFVDIFTETDENTITVLSPFDSGNLVFRKQA